MQMITVLTNVNRFDELEKDIGLTLISSGYLDHITNEGVTDLKDNIFKQVTEWMHRHIKDIEFLDLG